MPISSPPDPPELRVLVASTDAPFRRVAGAALSSAGHEVFLSAAVDERAVRLARLRRVHVVVIDRSDGGPALVFEATSERGAPGVVDVDVDAHGPVLEKWGPLEALVEAASTAWRPPASLRLVVGDR